MRDPGHGVIPSPPLSPSPAGGPPRIRPPPRAGAWPKTNDGIGPIVKTAPGAPRMPIMRTPTAPPLPAQRTNPPPSGGTAQKTLMYGTKSDAPPATSTSATATNLADDGEEVEAELAEEGWDAQAAPARDTDFSSTEVKGSGVTASSDGERTDVTRSAPPPPDPGNATSGGPVSALQPPLRSQRTPGAYSISGSAERLRNAPVTSSSAAMPALTNMTGTPIPTTAAGGSVPPAAKSNPPVPTAPGASGTAPGTARKSDAGRKPESTSHRPPPDSVRPPDPRQTEAARQNDASRQQSEGPPPSASANPLDREIRVRADRLKKDDPVGAARAHVELGLLCEWILYDRARARKHYETARELVGTLQPALGRIRRIGPVPSATPGVPPPTFAQIAKEALDVLDDEIKIAETDELRADLHATRARTLDAAGKLAEARGAYIEALRLSPKHPASLHGLEAILRREILEENKQLHSELADHLAVVVAEYGPDGTDGDAGLAAWICVERAEVVERKLQRVPVAHEALKRGVALAPNPGPVRLALVRHLARHDRDAGLADALRVEAEREADHDRAARLLYASARISLDRIGTRGDGISALTRAEQRAPHGSITQSRILAELIHQLEIDGDHTRLVELRVKRLALLNRREAIAFEYVRLADSYGRLGRADLAADAASRALSQDPSSRAVRETLDQSFQRLGRHPDRVRSWLLEANADRPVKDRVRAYVRAADICSRHLGQVDQAIDALRAAWLLDPGNGTVFDALSALLRAAPKATDQAQRNAEARIDLYEQASVIESDKERRLAFHEKILTIWEDELDRPDKVMEVAERMLAIEPTRRSAIVAVERIARRTGDLDKLAASLDQEAKQTQNATLKARLLLEAADVAERKGDRDRALSLIDRALATKQGDADAGRARVALLRRMARLDEARKTLVALAEHDPGNAFETWLEVADLDESFRKAPADAVEAYRAAHKIKPDHPLPMIALVRLLRATKNYKRLIAELQLVAKTEADPRALAQLLTIQAEIQELCLGDDEAAVKSLDAADQELVRDGAAEGAWDPGVFEVMERILFRIGDEDGLMRLYARWLERKPAASVDHALRVGLADALEAASPAQAIEVLEALVSVVPNHIPALRRLEHLHRSRKNPQALGATLLAQASVFASRKARVGALWEIVGLEEKLGAASTLDALARVTREVPQDNAALDTVMRIASRLVCNVGVPHPALLAARSQLLSAIRARRELTVDPLARAAFHIEEAALLESAEVDQNIRGALEGYREALGLWPDSFLAARGLERLATHLNDHQAVITSQLALAKLSDSSVGKAGHLVRAAELTASHLRDQRTALELYEVALESDPENRDASKTLVQLLSSDPKRLIERLRPALDRASTQAQVTLLGTEIAQSYLKIHAVEGEAARMDYGPGIQAMRRAMRATPDDVPSLFILSTLYGAQKAWAEARDTLQRVVELAGSTDTKARQNALFSLADLYDGPLGDVSLAETMLVNVLSTEPSSKLALERLYALGMKNGDKKLARSSLERLAEYETDLAQRTEYQLRVAEVAREANDFAGMLRALSDAVVSTPQDVRPWTLLARLCRGDTPEGAASLAHAIEQIIEMAKGRRRPLEPRWLLTLGLLEVNMLKRLNEGVTHLQAALGAASAPGSPPAHPEMRAALGSGLLSAGRTKDAIMVLRELVTSDAETLLRLAEPSAFNTVRSACVAATGTVLSAVLSCLDAGLATEGRTDERIAAEEARGVLGDLGPERLAKLRARRLEPDSPYPNALAASELTRMLLPEARSPFIDVGIAIQPISAKVLNFQLASYGLSARERIGPRDGHPVRAIADRVARCLGVPEFELILSGNWSGPLRVFPGDPPVVVGPLNFMELPDTEQVFGLGRALTRIALGMSWLEDVSPEVAEGMLLAAIRSVLPQWGLGELNPQREHALNNMHANMQRAIGRKQRKMIEDLGATLSASIDARAFFLAVRRSEYRSAYVLSGDLLGGIDTMRRSEPDLQRGADNARALLQYPLSSELIRYALSVEAYAERRRVGSVWGGAG